MGSDKNQKHDLNKESNDLIESYINIFHVKERPQETYDELLNDIEKSKSFLQYMSSCLCVIDYTTMKYLYVSDNIINWTGHTADEFKEIGPKYAISHFHPQDGKIIVNVLFKRIKEFLKEIPIDEKKNYRFSFNVRMKLSSGIYLPMMQQSTYLDFDSENNPRINVLTMTDISHLKKDNKIFLTISHNLDNAGFKTIQEEYIPLDETKFFTPTEKKVLQLISDGKQLSEIASALFISENTVKNHKKNMFAKTGAKNSIELIKYSQAKGIL